MTAVFDIPPVYCPIPSAVHPEASLIERGAVEWVDRCLRTDEGQRNRLLQSESAEFYARCAPGGMADRVQTVAQ